MSFLKAVLLEGDFITALPRGVLRQEHESGALVTIPYARGHLSRRGRSPSSLVRAADRRRAG
jgi:hypothetical protein